MKSNLFGEQLFGLRRRKKMLQKQVALGSGIDPSYLAALENGRRNPPRIQVVEQLLDAIDASPRERESLHQAAALARLIRVVARQEEILPGVTVALRMLEVAPVLSEEELTALDTLVVGLRTRSAV